MAFFVLYCFMLYAPVAQLDRVSDSDSEGRAFESRRAYHKKSTSLEVLFCFLDKIPDEVCDMIDDRCKENCRQEICHLDFGNVHQVGSYHND